MTNAPSGVWALRRDLLRVSLAGYIVPTLRGESRDESPILRDMSEKSCSFFSLR